MQKLFGDQKIEGPETSEDSNKHTGMPKGGYSVCGAVKKYIVQVLTESAVLKSDQIIWVHPSPQALKGKI